MHILNLQTNKMKYKIPETFMGKPVKGAMKRVFSQKSEEQEQKSTQPISSNKKDLDDFIYVPSISLYVAKETTFKNKNWHQCHEELQKQNQRMLVIPEFIEFLKYLKSQQNNQEYQDIYNEITEVRSPWRSEWLDAYFESKGGVLGVASEMHILTQNKLKSEKLESYLNQDKTPGIDLEDWINNPTKQGLPQSNYKDGSLHYWKPKSTRVARFVVGSGSAGLDCDWDPSGQVVGLGVRAVRHE